MFDEMVAICGICDEPTAEQKLSVGQTFFGSSFISETNRIAQFNDFFAYYSEQVALLRLQYGPKYKHSWALPMQSHEELVKVVKIFQQVGASSARPTIREKIKKELNVPQANKDALNEVIDITLRFWLMLNFRDRKHSGMAGGRPCIQWDDNISLKKCLAELFKKPELELTPSQCRLSPHFTAANMKNICRLKIRWTTSMEDHLRLDREHRTLWVFSDRQFIWAHVANSMESSQDAGGTAPRSPTVELPYPDGLLQETNKTLDLLFPSWDKGTQQLLHQCNKNFHRLQPQPRSLDLKSYPYWKERLLEMYEEVYLAPPVSWAQLWRDRRDPQRFWTFWIALVILVLTTVSTLTSVVQTWATVKGLR